jgi:hypothetical protein
MTEVQKPVAAELIARTWPNLISEASSKYMHDDLGGLSYYPVRLIMKGIFEKRLSTKERNLG